MKLVDVLTDMNPVLRIFLNLSLSPGDPLIQQASFLHQVTIGSHLFEFAGFQDTDFIVSFDDIQGEDSFE